MPAHHARQQVNKSAIDERKSTNLIPLELKENYKRPTFLCRWILPNALTFIQIINAFT